MQRAGHKPIALMGGGTAMIGDPSGKTDMRKMLTVETIDHNVECIRQQMSRFLDFSDGKALIVNNGDWLRHLNFIDFMRDIGSQFSVNRMLTAECYKARMATENGLSFLEFTYMLMQSYDFLELFHRYGCRLEMGGNDQWSNMLGGADLVRKKENEKAFACTFQLLLTHDGRKMGKTEAGALWLDPAKTSPYNFYQYWRNVDDKDVEKCLALLTFLPMDEVRRLGALKDAEINEAKKCWLMKSQNLSMARRKPLRLQKPLKLCLEEVPLLPMCQPWKSLRMNGHRIREFRHCLSDQVCARVRAMPENRLNRMPFPSMI